MNNLEQHFNSQLKQIETLDNAIVLLHHKTKILPDLKALEIDLREVNNIVSDVKKVKHETSSLKKEYKLLTRKLQKQQLIMLNMIQKADNCRQLHHHEMMENNKNHLNVLAPGSRQRCPSVESGYKISLYDFQNSPFVSKIKPLSLNFLDFEKQLTQDEFNMIPKYMKGRETLEEMNYFLEKTVSKCFNDKYSLLFKQRKAVKQCDKELWNRYQMQIKYCPGTYII